MSFKTSFKGSEYEVYSANGISKLYIDGKFKNNMLSGYSEEIDFHTFMMWEEV